MSRIDQRADTNLSITIMRAGKQGRAQLRNISHSGASATAPFPPGLNEDVQMICKGQILECKVAWARGRELGLAFLHPLTAAKLQALLITNSDSVD